MKKWLKNFVLKKLRPELELLFYEELRAKVISTIRSLEDQGKTYGYNLPEEEIADLVIRLIKGDDVEPRYRLLLRSIITALIYREKS